MHSTIEIRAARHEIIGPVHVRGNETVRPIDSCYLPPLIEKVCGLIGYGIERVEL